MSHSQGVFEAILAPSPKSGFDLGEGRGWGLNWLTTFACTHSNDMLHNCSRILDGLLRQNILIEGF